MIHSTTRRALPLLLVALVASSCGWLGRKRPASPSGSGTTQPVPIERAPLIVETRSPCLRFPPPPESAEEAEVVEKTLRCPETSDDGCLDWHDEDIIAGRLAQLERWAAVAWGLCAE